MSEQTFTFTEAPASCNVKFNWRGFDTMLTLRDTSGKALLDKMGAVLDTLEKLGAEPTGYRSNGQSREKQNGENDPGFCQVHQCAMKRWEKDGRVWYSHKSPDGSWCKGK